MKTFEYTITDPVGIHARPAGLLVKAVKEHASKVTITKKNPDGKERGREEASGADEPRHQAGRHRYGFC